MPVNQILTWLELMRLKYEFDDVTRTFKLVYKVDGNPLNAIIIARMDGWIKIRVMLANIKDVAEADQFAFTSDLLKQNFENDDVTFSMDETGILYSENDTQKSSNLDNFYTELNAVVFGASLFIKIIAPKYNLTEHLLHGVE
ncbi:MAG: hypothetical protein ACTSV2_03790 [Candidatus Thorarchaeota archaeon]